MTQAERTAHAAEKAEKDTSRLEVFSDGVFAIAITLLVLDLKVPPGLASPAALVKALLGLWPNYLTFVLHRYNLERAIILM